MPLEPTGNRPPQRNESLVSRRSLLGLAALGMAATVLVSCSQGTSRDAERGQRQDAERTSVVDNLQATETARLINGSPDASPPAELEE